MTRTVACVLRTGQRVTDKQPYRVEHVVKLRNGVAQHLATPHRFVCLTDQFDAVTDAGIDAVTLPVAWPGWWAKMNLYAPDLLTGSVLYLDLDSLIVGPLEPLFRTAPGITMVPDFIYPENMNSSAMALMGDLCGLFYAFSDSQAAIRARYDAYPRARVGDQGYVHDTLREMGHPIDIFDPKHVVSFKRDCKTGIPDDARVISYHGVPKCDDPRSGWAFEMWSAL